MSVRTQPAATGATTERPAESVHVPALDGVRALAVTLVLLFHLRLPGSESGFMGVDVFFVLSGFLITTLLLDEMRRTGGVSLLAFWARRARRLLPALVLVLLVVALYSAFAVTNTERQALRGDLLSTTFYAANWRFLDTSDYFSDTGIGSPIQHAWSLGIEEQFYLVWPLLVSGAFVLLRRPSAAVAALSAALGIGSYLLLQAIWAPDQIERAYMGTDTRVFEPLIGALGASLLATPRVRGLLRRWGTWLAVVGTVGVVTSLVAVRVDPQGYYVRGALLLSLSTLALIAPLWVGRGGVIRRSLQIGPVAWIGAVSYGLYLWHWPLTVWLGARDPWREDLMWRRAAVVLLTPALAALSYYLVERPIRTGGRAGHADRRVWAKRTLAAVPVALVTVAAVSLGATYVPLPRPEDRVLMVVGDSVPKRLESTLDAALESRGWRLVSATHGGCSVTGEVGMLPTGRVMPISEPCPGEVPATQDELIGKVDPDVILWWDRFSVSGFVTDEGQRVLGGSDLFWDLRREKLDETIRRLQAGGSVIAFVATEPPGRQIFNASGQVRREWAAYQVIHFDDITERWNRILRRYSKHSPGTTFVDVTPVVCHTETVPCDDTIGGYPAREDGVHYAGPGRERVVEAILEQLGPTLAAFE